MSWINELLADPRTALMLFALALPGRLLAISAHEAAHGWVADRCGDPSARLLGRVTLNPIAHFDALGMLAMLVVGLGWAKPVPINPRNLRHPRRDDVLISLAGITANLILFLLNLIALYALILTALSRLPSYDNVFAMMQAKEDLYVGVYNGERCLMFGNYYAPLQMLFTYPGAFSDELIVPVFGQTVGYISQILYYAATTNLCLAAFNLLPIPPLDGSHVLMRILHRDGFAPTVTRAMGTMLMVVLLMTNWLGTGLSYVLEWALNGCGTAAYALALATGLL